MSANANVEPFSVKDCALVTIATGGDKDIHVLLLPPDAHVTVNALQRGADLVVQKSLKKDSASP